MNYKLSNLTKHQNHSLKDWRYLFSPIQQFIESRQNQGIQFSSSQYQFIDQEMSRCQHGEVISKFCISETCTWRDAGGCETCFRKYHAHASNLDTVSLEQLQKMNGALTVKAEIKVKVRPLQQAIYNYFMVIKSQISSSIDAVSRIVSNKLSYPYLTQQEQLTVFKKLKNREYKKIGKKQLRSFYEFATNISTEALQLQEKSLYFSEVQEFSKVFHKINQVFKEYQQAVCFLDTSFNVEKSFIQKINELTNSIKTNNPKSTNEVSSTKGSSSIPTVIVKPEQKRVRDRKVSFDSQIGNHDFSRFGQDRHNNKSSDAYGVSSYDDNERQIIERKKKLMDMLSGQKSPNKIMDTIKVEQKHIQLAGREVEERSKQKNQHQSLDKKILADSEKRKRPSPLFVEDSLKRYPGNNSGNKSDGGNSQKSQQGNFNLFQKLADMGMDFSDMIVHTIIPMGVQKIKLYEDTRDVKQQKIIVPVKKFEELEEASSPLLKKRKTKGGTGGNFKLFRVDSNRDEELQNIDEEESPAKEEPQMVQPIREEKEEEEQMVLKEKEAQSLALLVQSFRLPAEKAIPLLQAAVKYASNNLSACEYLSYLYLETGKPKKCLDLCNSMLEQLEDSPEAGKLSVHISNNKAAALNTLGRYSESISILEKCLEYSCKDIYYKNLGDSYFSIGIYDKAAFNYEKAIALNNELDEAYYNLAVSLYLQGHFNECKLYVKQAMKKNGSVKEYEDLMREVSAKAPS